MSQEFLLGPALCFRAEKIYFADTYEKSVKNDPRIQNRVALQILFAIMKHNFKTVVINRREKTDIYILSSGKCL